jgi:hypothetical protein
MWWKYVLMLIFSEFYIFIEFLFHSLHCLSYFIQQFFYSLTIYSNVHLYPFFNFIDHSCNHSSEFFVILPLHYC